MPWGGNTPATVVRVLGDHDRFMADAVPSGVSAAGGTVPMRP